MSNRPLSPPLQCRLCGCGPESLQPTTLRTCEDLEHLGEFGVTFCTTCRNAFTHPLPAPDAAEIKPDVAFTRLSGLQRTLMNGFLDARLRRILTHVSEPAGKRAIDLGSGACAFANRIAAAGFHVTAIEPNPHNRAFAAAGVEFVPRLFAEDLVQDGTLREEAYDVITSWHSLEHLPDPAAALQLMHRLLRPGGQLHLSVPNWKSLQARLGAIVGPISTSPITCRISPSRASGGWSCNTASR